MIVLMMELIALEELLDTLIECFSAPITFMAIPRPNSFMALGLLTLKESWVVFIFPLEPSSFQPSILGSFTSVLQVFLGYQAGQIIMSYQGHRGRLIRFVIWALLNGAIGFALNGATRDEGLIPINKNLW